MRPPAPRLQGHYGYGATLLKFGGKGGLGARDVEIEVAKSWFVGGNF